MRDILIVGFFLFVVYHSMRRPYVGVCAWVWIALTAPTEWVYGFSSSLRLNLTIVLVTALAYVLASRKKDFNLGTLGWLVVVFMLHCLVSTLAHNTGDGHAVMSDYIGHVKIAMLFLFITLVIRTRAEITAVVWCFILSVSSFAAMEGTKFLLSLGGHAVEGRAGIILDRNHLAVAINMCIPLIFFLIQVTNDRRLKLGLLGMAVLNMVAAVGTYSRGGFIGLCVIGAAAWMASRHKLAIALATLVIAPVAFQLTPDAWRERQATVGDAATEDGSFIGRLWAWKISAMIAGDDPLTGGGYKAVTDPLLWNLHAPQTQFFGFIETPPIPEYVIPKAAHNIFFQVLGDHGYLGLLLFLLILTRAFFDNLRNISAARIAGQPWLADLCVALNVGMIGYAVNGMNVSLAYFDLSYAFFALVVVINGYLAQQRPRGLASSYRAQRLSRSAAVQRS